MIEKMSGTTEWLISPPGKSPPRIVRVAEPVPHADHSTVMERLLSYRNAAVNRLEETAEQSAAVVVQDDGADGPGM